MPMLLRFINHYYYYYLGEVARDLTLRQVELFWARSDLVQSSRIESGSAQLVMLKICITTHGSKGNFSR